MKFLTWTYLVIPIATVLGLPAPKPDQEERDVHIKDPYTPKAARKRDAGVYEEREASSSAHDDVLRRRDPGIDIEVERDVPDNHEEGLARREKGGGAGNSYCSVM